MSKSRIENILVNECVLNYLAYSKHLADAGYTLLDLRECETDPVGTGSSDGDIFSWIVSHIEPPAILTLNVKDFRKLNSRSPKKVIVLKSPVIVCEKEVLVAALDFIQTLPHGYYYSIPAAIAKLNPNLPSSS